MLFFSTSQLSTAEDQDSATKGVWLEPPKSLAEQKGQPTRSETVIIEGMIYGDRGSRQPYRLECHMRVVKPGDLKKADFQIPGYLFGFGKLAGSGARSNVQVLRKVILSTGNEMLEVPNILLDDLSRPEIPQYVVVFRHNDNVVVQIGGPDGSEGYEVEFVSKGGRFLYRLIRFEPGSELKEYPSPLRKDV